MAKERPDSHHRLRMGGKRSYTQRLPERKQAVGTGGMEGWRLGSGDRGCVATHGLRVRKPGSRLSCVRRVASPLRASGLSSLFCKVKELN